MGSLRTSPACVLDLRVEREWWNNMMVLFQVFSFLDCFFSLWPFSDLNRSEGL